MAKIHEELVVIKLSKLIKDSEHGAESTVSPDVVANLEVLVQELVGNGVVVEIIKE